MKITLYEIIKLCNISGVEIQDNDFDFVTFFSCKVNKGQCTTYYDKLKRLFATQIECDFFDVHSLKISCYISEFIRKHSTCFNVFMSHYNLDGYEKPQEYDLIESDDILWSDTYLDTFDCIVKGCYNEDQCKELYQLLGGN